MVSWRFLATSLGMIQSPLSRSTWDHRALSSSISRCAVKSKSLNAIDPGSSAPRLPRVCGSSAAQKRGNSAADKYRSRVGLVPPGFWSNAAGLFAKSFS